MVYGFILQGERSEHHSQPVVSTSRPSKRKEFHTFKESNVLLFEVWTVRETYSWTASKKET